MYSQIRYRVTFGQTAERPSRWKRTNEGWPDPNTWLQGLLSALEDRYAQYELETDTLLRRNKAAAMLAQVLASLHQLPPFHIGHAHMPLKDLLIFLSDLDKGRSPPWAKPTNFGGTSVTTTAENELRLWVNGVVHVLYCAGLGRTEAYRAVADGLTKHGRRGQGGGPVPWRSVQQWCTKLGHPTETMIGRRIMDWWQMMPCTHGNLVTNCNTGAWNVGHCRDAAKIARRFSDEIWSLPHHRDLAVSTGHSG